MVSVRRAKWKPAGAAKKAPAVDGFEVLLEDTVLFPEGGGQNTDKGTISNASGEASFPVLHVFRHTGGSEGEGGLTAVHFIAGSAPPPGPSNGDQPSGHPDGDAAAPLAVGDSVRVSLDWGRRFDNMQQHSGQHLVSALFENRQVWGMTSMGTCAFIIFRVAQ